MTDKSSLVGGLLSQLLSRAAYVYFLARHVAQVGVRVDGVVMLLDLNARTGEVSVTLCELEDQARPTLWVECALSELESAARDGTSVTGLVIRTGPMGQVVHPRAEQLLIRCFQAPPYPIDDREELIYPALFGFEPPRIVWESRQTLLRVLHYEDSASGSSFCVSSGLSEPWAWQPAEIYDQGVSGAGYELVVKTLEPAVVKEFSGWVQYVEQSESHLLPGNWLEYEAGKLIPGTNLAGFLVVKPTSFLPDFPVGSSNAHWHSLVPVSLAQLDHAKRSDVFQVAEMVEDKVRV